MPCSLPGAGCVAHFLALVLINSCTVGTSTKHALLEGAEDRVALRGLQSSPTHVIVLNAGIQCHTITEFVPQIHILAVVKIVALFLQNTAFPSSVALPSSSRITTPSSPTSPSAAPHPKPDSSPRPYSPAQPPPRGLPHALLPLGPASCHPLPLRPRSAYAPLPL